MILDKHDWHEYFERLSRAVVESRAETEVAALPRGLRTDAAWVALVAVLYDSERDVIEMVFELPDKTSEDYLIHGPREVLLDERKDGLTALEVTDSDGAAHRVALRAPLEMKGREELKE